MLDTLSPPQDSPDTDRNRGGKSAEYLTFRLGDEQYGIDILQVQEIRSYEQPTRMVQAPNFIKGVIDLRGRIVPIVDLRMKLQCPSADYTDFTVVIILNVRDLVVGIVVDAVADVVALAPSAIKPAPQIESQMDAAFVTGIATLDKRMLIMVDIEALLGSADMGLIRSVAPV